MIPLLIILLIILSGSIFLSIIFHKKIEETLIVWMLGIVFLLYLFGLAGFLKYGVYFIEIMSIAMLSYIIYRFIKCKTKTTTIKSYLTPGLVIFFIFFIMLNIIHSGRMLISWDEFSHWGDSVRAMYDINDFVTSPLSNSLFKSYPPAMSLFQYFFMVINRGFNEGLLYTSYQLIGVSLFLPFTKNLEWKKCKSIILVLIIIFIIPSVFYINYYSTIFIDAMIGLTFASLIGIIIQNERLEKFEIISLCLYSFFLTLLKDVGLFFSIISIVALMFKLLKNNKFSFKHFIKNYKNLNCFLPLLFVILCTCFAKLSWNYEIISNSVDHIFNIKNGILDIIKLLFGFDNTYRSTVYSNYREALFSINLISNFISFNYCRLFIINLFIVIHLCNIDKKNKPVFIIVFMGLIFYTIGLLITYCFSFTKDEALLLASYSRYINIYFNGFLSILFVYLLIKNQKKILLFFGFVLLMFAPIKNIIDLPFNRLDASTIRTKYDNDVSGIKTIVNSNKKVYIIVQHTAGYEYWVLRYTMRPIEINPNFSWSIGKKYDDEDLWTQNTNSSTWMKELINNYDYVYIYMCDDQFKNEFGDLFDKKENINSKQLYKINKKSKKLELIERNVIK